MLVIYYTKKLHNLLAIQTGYEWIWHDING